MRKMNVSEMLFLTARGKKNCLTEMRQFFDVQNYLMM